MATSEQIIAAPIPLCEPNLRGNEKKYTADAIDSNWLSGGSYLRLFEQKLTEYTGAQHVIGTSSGTTALQIALILAGVEKGDLVLVPGMTFVATANAVKYLGADPIIIDIDPDTWLMDNALLQDFLVNQTYQTDQGCIHKASKRRIKALVPVHLLGNVCDMSMLLPIAQQFAITVVEDAACSLGSFQNGRHSGTSGLVGTMSFNSNKIITTAGGGAILTNDEILAKRARHLITQAKSHQTEYYHDGIGFNYRLVNPLAAMGAAQMEQLPGFVKTKKEIAAYYLSNLSDLDVAFQVITQGTDPNYWHFALLTARSREIIAALASQNIETRPLWTPLNLLPAFRDDLFVTNHDVSARVSQQGLMLPCSTSISSDQLERVCSNLRKLL
ncbi:LegC family aminotransferase [Dyadobacter sp. MSC1_007]|jgi:perosamine synthetase|uniref:LegC family aminotransferase n=1 Tax=Dyadobacter sp. MSC1_007 TaxID=2909264 RepID=UPI00202E1B9D|nr:LegC family aminotransferase [Dyadobacter sp. MSC1_007]